GVALDLASVGLGQEIALVAGDDVALDRDAVGAGEQDAGRAVARRRVVVGVDLVVQDRSTGAEAELNAVLRRIAETHRTPAVDGRALHETGLPGFVTRAAVLAVVLDHAGRDAQVRRARAATLREDADHRLASRGSRMEDVRHVGRVHRSGRVAVVDADVARRA